MKNLYKHLIREYYNYLVDNEFSILEGYNIIVNESFNSSIIQKLATKIYNIEKSNNINKVKRAKSDDERYPLYDGKKRDPQLTNFSSIFGPISIKNNEKFGIKWSEISDSDFKTYTDTSNKELIKLLKKSYANDTNMAIFIITDSNNDIMYFIKCFGKNYSGIYTFVSDHISKSGYKVNGQVKQLKKPYYTYNVRSFKLHEVLDLLNDYSDADIKIYALEITDKMTHEYKNLILSREKSQKGVINYDKESLSQLLREQKARYNTLVDEIKAKKLQSDPNILFDDITKTNNDVIDLFKTIMSKPEYMDLRINLGDLMQYVGYAYSEFYESVKRLRDSERVKDRAKTRAKERGEEFDDKSYSKYDYDKIHSDESIRRAKEYIERVKKEIEKIKNKL